MSWNDFLPDLAVKHEVLESLYADVGTPDDQKAKECQALFDRFMDVINDHIDKVQKDKSRFVQECEQMIDNIKRMTALIGEGEEGITRLMETLEGMNLWSRHSLLREEYTYILEHYTQKLEEIRTLHRELAGFAAILGPTYVQAGPFPEEGVAVTFDVVQQFSDNIDACKKEQKRRTAEVESTIITIKHLYNELGSTGQDALEKVITEAEQGHYSLTEESMRRLETKKKMLEDERSKREVVVKDHLTTIIQLWDKLRIEEEEREEFMTSHIGLALDTVRAYKAELARLMELRSEKLPELIMDERNNLYELWDKLYYSPEEQDKFAPLFDDKFTEESLATHEAEVARLKQQVEEDEHILNAIEQYRRLLDDIREFEVTSMDARRLFHRDPGRLLREEKFRKRISREFPKVEKELEDALYEWQQTKGTPFLVYGEDYLKTMKRHAQEAREGKENEKLWREQRREMLLQRELRYGSHNPKKVPPQSPHPRRISPSFVPPPELPGLASPVPQTPNSKRIGDRIGTPSSQHKRTTPSVHPSTPTRRRPQAAPSTPGQSSTLQSPQSFHSLQLQRSNSFGNKTYSRSESPATTFTLSRLISSPGPKPSNVRHSDSGPIVIGREPGRSRNNSAVELSTGDTDNPEPQTPTRSSRINRPITSDLARQSIQEEDEEMGDRMPSRTPRSLKRRAADLTSPSRTPPGSPSVQRSHHRKRSRSISPQSEKLSSATNDSPFVSKAIEIRDSGMTAAKESERGNAFMSKLMEIRQEQTHDSTNAIEIVEDMTEDDSVIEMDRSEAAVFFSASKKATKVVVLHENQDNDSEGWVTDDDDISRSRWKLAKDNQDTATRTSVPRNHKGSGDSSGNEDDAYLVEGIPLSTTPSKDQGHTFEIGSAGS